MTSRSGPVCERCAPVQITRPRPLQQTCSSAPSSTRPRTSCAPSSHRPTAAPSWQPFLLPRGPYRFPQPAGLLVGESITYSHLLPRLFCFFHIVFRKSCMICIHKLINNYSSLLLSMPCKSELAQYIKKLTKTFL